MGVTAFIGQFSFHLQVTWKWKTYTQRVSAIASIFSTFPAPILPLSIGPTTVPSLFAAGKRKIRGVPGVMAWESLHATSVKGAARDSRFEVVPERGPARAVVKRQAVASVNCIFGFGVRFSVSRSLSGCLLSDVRRLGLCAGNCADELMRNIWLPDEFLYTPNRGL